MSKKSDSDDSDEIEFIEETKNTKDETKSRSFKHKNKSQEHSPCRKELSNNVSSRRKTVHKVINENDEILFESYPKLTDVTKNSTERRTKAMPKLISRNGNDNYKKYTTATGRKNHNKDAHPGIEHMHRIAFLKACSNYMLTAVGKETMDFEKTGLTLSKLVNKYNGISPIEDEVIGISD